MRKALLALADGTVFQGWSFGAEGETVGEVVFNTSMMGYQEMLSDPSYKGQMVAMTYTEIGNYGVNEEDFESSRIHVEGFIVKEAWETPSNWRATKSLHRFLADQGVVGIQGIDTRALTRRLREKGSMIGVIATGRMPTPTPSWTGPRSAPAHRGARPRPGGHVPRALPVGGGGLVARGGATRSPGARAGTRWWPTTSGSSTTSCAASRRWGAT